LVRKTGDLNRLWKTSHNNMPFPVETKWIRETEAKLGVGFPAEFVSAMAKMNGGTVRTSIDDFEIW